MYSLGVSESMISLFVPKACKAIYDTLQEDYLMVPSSAADWLNISQDFENRWNIPNTIGAYQVVNIPIVFNAPKSAGSVYFNYKSTHSIILLALIVPIITLDEGKNLSDSFKGFKKGVKGETGQASKYCK